MSAWEAVLFPWEARRALCLVECLGFCLPDLVPWLPAWLVGRLLPAWEELSLAGVWVVTSLPAWEEMPSPGKEGTAWVITELLPTLGEVEHLPGKPDCLPEMALNCFLPQGKGECLPAWEAKFGKELTLVIFPSFLFSKLLNLFSCLCLTLLNIISPTFPMKPWHSLSLCADRIDANCDLHSSVCLAMLSRILFRALTLAWSKSFSAFLTIFLAFSVFKSWL